MVDLSNVFYRGALHIIYYYTHKLRLIRLDIVRYRNLGYRQRR